MVANQYDAHAAKQRFLFALPLSQALVDLAERARRPTIDISSMMRYRRGLQSFGLSAARLPT